MVSRTAEDVADMEQELLELRVQLDSATRSLDLMTQERNRLQVENALLDGKVRDNLVKATRIETVLSQVAHLLVTSLKEIQTERETARVARRQEQEDRIIRDEPPPPAFLRADKGLEREASAYRGDRDEEPPAPRQPRSIGMTEAEGQRARAEQLRGAAERIASRLPPPPPRRPGQMNPDLAGRDPRLPQNDFQNPQQQDEDQLRGMHERLDRRG